MLGYTKGTCTTISWKGIGTLIGYHSTKQSSHSPSIVGIIGTLGSPTTATDQLLELVNRRQPNTNTNA